MMCKQTWPVLHQRPSLFYQAINTGPFSRPADWVSPSFVGGEECKGGVGALSLGLPAVTLEGTHSSPLLGNAACPGSFWGFPYRAPAKQEIRSQLDQAGPHAPGTQSLVKQAESLGSLGKEGQGHSPPPTLP